MAAPVAHMPIDTSWMARLGLRHPIIQAPMAGTATPRLAAAVSNAGGLGSLGLGASTTEQARQQIVETRALTAGAFNINLFCHRPAQTDPQRETAWLARLAPEFERFDAQPPARVREIYLTAVGDTALQAMVLEERPAAVSFHFGLPEQPFIDALREAGIVTLACATTLDEALQIERAGIDVVVAQGIEAGGHRGVFEPSQDRMLGTFALVQLLARHIRLPVVAAGGVMDGDGIAAALQLGACAVQMGTAFILCPESAASPAYRADLQSERAQHTGITAAISGRPARGIVNRMHEIGHAHGQPLPDFSRAYDAGKALHQVAARHGCADYAAHWAGQGAPLAREMPAGELVQTLVDELHSKRRVAEAGE